MINVSKNFNNYNTEIISTKCFSKKLFPSEILPFSPSYIPLLYLSWKVQELKKCHAVPNHITRENCERHKVFIFFNDGSCGWVTKVKEKWWQDWKWPSCLELIGFLAQPTKIHVLYLLYEIHLPYPTWLPNKSQLDLMDFAIFCCIHLSAIVSLLIFPGSLPSAVIDFISGRDVTFFF